jgi:hypothetical protein
MLATMAENDVSIIELQVVCDWDYAVAVCMADVSSDGESRYDVTRDMLQNEFHNKDELKYATSVLNALTELEG